MFSKEFDRKGYCEKVRSKLRILRAAANISQEEAAQALGLVRSTYVNYENGSRVLPWEKCLAFLFYFYTVSGSRELIEELHLLPEEMNRE